MKMKMSALLIFAVCFFCSCENGANLDSTETLNSSISATQIEEEHSSSSPISEINEIRITDIKEFTDLKYVALLQSGIFHGGLVGYDFYFIGDRIQNNEEGILLYQKIDKLYKTDNYKEFEENKHMLWNDGQAEEEWFKKLLSESRLLAVSKDASKLLYFYYDLSEINNFDNRPITLKKYNSESGEILSESYWKDYWFVSSCSFDDNLESVFISEKILDLEKSTVKEFELDYGDEYTRKVIPCQNSEKYAYQFYSGGKNYINIADSQTDELICSILMDDEYYIGVYGASGELLVSGGSKEGTYVVKDDGSYIKKVFGPSEPIGISPDGKYAICGLPEDIHLSFEYDEDEYPVGAYLIEIETGKTFVYPEGYPVKITSWTFKEELKELVE